MPWLLEADQKKMWTLLSHPDLLFVFLAPPCGAASRAREIRIRDEHGPPPLRSEEEPLGIASVLASRPLDKLRVETANVLYALCAQVILFCEDKGIAWCVENPTNSLFWWHPDMDHAVHKTKAQWTDLQNCAFGGERPKWISLLRSPAHLFRALAAHCPGILATHVHAPWGRQAGGFSTALEAVYPDGL